MLKIYCVHLCECYLGSMCDLSFRPNNKNSDKKATFPVICPDCVHNLMFLEVPKTGNTALIYLIPGCVLAFLLASVVSILQQLVSIQGIGRTCLPS